MARKVGQIIARGGSRWLIRVYLGRDHETNKRTYHNRTIQGPMREAQAYLTRKLRERDLGRDLEGAKITLNEYLDRWLETAVRPRVRAQTFQDYQGMLQRYVRPILGERVLAGMRPLDLQSMYHQMSERGLSARTVRYTHVVVKSAMQQAVRWRLLLENPADGLKVPQQPRNEMRALTVDQARTSVRANHHVPMYHNRRAHGVGDEFSKKRIATMQTLTSTTSLLPAYLKRNLQETRDNVVAPIRVPHKCAIFRKSLVVASVLAAFAISGFGQTQQLATNVAAEQPDGKASNDAVVEKSATAASNSATDQSQSAAGLSNEIANPLSNLWLLQMQQNNTLLQMPSGNGTYAQHNLQFQPLLPIHVSPHWNWISRPVMQIVSSQPYPVPTSVNSSTGTTNLDIKRTTGFGDMIFATAISPDRSLVGNWLLGAGATFIFPTATHNVLGQNTWQAGPTIAIGYKGPKWIAYVFPQHWWKIGGDGKKTNQTLVQYNFAWSFDSGWSVGSNPSFSVNWEAPSGQRVTFPVGLQVGKLLHAGPMPVKVDLQALYYAVRPTNYYGTAIPSPKWGFQLQLTPVIPSLIHGFKPKA